MNTKAPVIYVIDDDREVLQSIEFLLHSIDIGEVRAFTDPNKFLDSIDSVDYGCIISDVRMPNISGLELLDAVRTKGHFLPLIFITGFADVPMCVKAMRNGAFHFLEKPVRDQDLIDSINDALNTCKEYMLNKPKGEEALLKSLTPKEREVAELLVKGHRLKEISTLLNVTHQTASRHRAKILTKMGVTNDVELYRKAHRYFS